MTPTPLEKVRFNPISTTILDPVSGNCELWRWPTIANMWFDRALEKLWNLYQFINGQHAWITKRADGSSTHTLKTTDNQEILAWSPRPGPRNKLSLLVSWNTRDHTFLDSNDNHGQRHEIQKSTSLADTPSTRSKSNHKSTSTIRRLDGQNYSLEG